METDESVASRIMVTTAVEVENHSLPSATNYTEDNTQERVGEKIAIHTRECGSLSPTMQQFVETDTESTV